MDSCCCHDNLFLILENHNTILPFLSPLCHTKTPSCYLVNSVRMSGLAAASPLEAITTKSQFVCPSSLLSSTLYPSIHSHDAPAPVPPRVSLALRSKHAQRVGQKIVDAKQNPIKTENSIVVPIQYSAFGPMKYSYTGNHYPRLENEANARTMRLRETCKFL